MTLNDDKNFGAASEDVRRAFRRQSATKKYLRQGHALYKYTGNPLADARGEVTPWWFSVEPLCPQDLGLDGLMERANRTSGDTRAFARARGAVTKQWNTMEAVAIVRLLIPVFGFYGQCSGQRVDKAPEAANVFFIGGAWQLWIPDLQPSHIEEADHF